MPTFLAGYYVDESKIGQIKDMVSKNDQSDVSVVDMFYNEAKKELYCILDAPDEIAIKNYHTKINLMRDLLVMAVEPILTQNRQNREKFKIIGEMSTRLAHDLRNPLSIIKNTVEIIETKQDLNAEDRDICYDRIHRAIDRISHQIDNVLDFVRPTQTSFEKNLLNNILSSAIERIAKPDTIKIIMPTNLVYAVCDFTKLEVVFINLIMNSIQAIANSGQIEIKFIEDDKNTSIQISDTGCGIPQDVLPKIFEPLFTTKRTGTGLGLPSCKQIIEEHYGTIKVSSEMGSGTTFTLVLPKNKFIAAREPATKLVRAR